MEKGSARLQVCFWWGSNIITWYKTQKCHIYIILSHSLSTKSPKPPISFGCFSFQFSVTSDLNQLQQTLELSSFNPVCFQNLPTNTCLRTLHMLLATYLTFVTISAIRFRLFWCKIVCPFFCGMVYIFVSLLCFLCPRSLF